MSIILDHVNYIYSKGTSDEIKALDDVSALPEQCGLGELPALSEPGSYGPVRAFGAYAGDRSRKTGEIRNQKKEIRNSSEADGKIEIRENEKPKEEPKYVEGCKKKSYSFQKIS